MESYFGKGYHLLVLKMLFCKLIEFFTFCLAESRKSFGRHGRGYAVVIVVNPLLGERRRTVQ